MKNLVVISLFAGIALLGITACSNDLDLTTDWEDIPVVYGLLSRQDTAHYIKIQKAFLDPERSALDIAMIPDSLYYENLQVEVEHLKSGKIYTLTRVDGNLEGFEKEGGIFSDAPNYLYKFKLDNNEKLVGGDTYRLTINRGDNKPEVTAEDVIVSDLNIISPFEGSNLRIINRDFTIQWRSEDDARLFDLKMRFNYQENSLHPDSLNIFTDKTLVWTIAKNIARPGGNSLQTKFDFPGQGLYSFLDAELQAHPLLRRFFTSIEFEVIAGGKEIFEYINIGQANTGITSSQVIPTYTNLSEGFGVFSSINNVVSAPFFSLHPEMRDSLEFGVQTADLNFQL